MYRPTYSPIPNPKQSDKEKARRLFTESRHYQGFSSQEMLDAFYIYFDHTKACPLFQAAIWTCPVCKVLDQYTDTLRADPDVMPYELRTFDHPSSKRFPRLHSAYHTAPLQWLYEISSCIRMTTPISST